MTNRIIVTNEKHILVLYLLCIYFNYSNTCVLQYTYMDSGMSLTCSTIHVHGVFLSLLCTPKKNHKYHPCLVYTSLTLEESLYASHLLHHLSKLLVLGQKLIDLPNGHSRSSCHPLDPPRLSCKQPLSIQTVQLCFGKRTHFQEKIQINSVRYFFNKF